MEVTTRQGDASKRTERAHRILDAAAALILRYGYNKTTLDDVAKQADVAKGTLYLHWNTREELFLALMTREKMELAEDFRRRIAADPAAPALGAILKHSALALAKRPLLKAVLLGDADVIGKLAHSQRNSADALERLGAFHIFLEVLREHGLVRTDLSLQSQMYMVSAIFMGFFLVAPMVAEALVPSDEERAELIAETVHQTLEQGRVASAEQRQVVAQAFNRYFDHAVAMAQQRFQAALEPKSARTEERSQ